MEKSMAVPQIIRGFPYDPAVPILGVYNKREKPRSVSSRDICTPTFKAAFIIA